ncbi:MAG: serine/threonine protein kinase [Deltaproteobacteria bacterium]|nr:serine/threonine protein kinase [Deltaproteobacteria bacterium]
MDSRYRITGVLGSGGMGCVYLAEHVSIRRPLALKLLHPEVEEIEEVAKRFEREAFAIGRVDHPNCVNVSDFGKFGDGTFYMVLELLDGVLLFDLLERKTRLEWKRALHIGRHVLSALAYAHDAGIIHRDVKPENVILVDQDGDPDFAKILDFGIAKLHDDAQADSDTGLLTNDNKLTQQGITIGTPTYIAPEQAYGLSVDQRADLYSLSVMLYEMITGVPPFDADEVGALLRMHVSATVPTFAEVAPDVEVPEAVERLIRHGLEKKADDRIGSAQGYIDQIDEILDSESGSGLREIPLRVVNGFRGTLGPAVQRVVPTKKTAKRVVGAALLVIALTAGLAFALGSSGPANFADDVEEVGEESRAQMMLGHAEASAQRSLHALIAYEKAVTLEPNLARDTRMRTNVELMLEKKAPRVVDAALEFLGTLAATGDGAAVDQLIDLASSSKVPRRRHKAVAVADAVGLGDRVDRLGSYLLDLQQGESCQHRKVAVANLRALGNKNAIPALRKARKRIRSEGGFAKKKVNANACLSADAAEAIRYLQSL